MTNRIVNTLVHVLAIVSGTCTLLAVGLTQPPFSVSPIWAGGLALAATVCAYIANSLPALSEPSAMVHTFPETPDAPQVPVAPPPPAPLPSEPAAPGA